MNQQNGLMALPFDSTQDNRKEITAAQRRRLYRDLWSDMIVRAFSFTSVGNGNFAVNGTCLVNGAYAAFDNFTLNTAEVQAGQTQVVARIVSDGQGGENVGIRFVNTAGANDLRIGIATIAAGPVVTQIAGMGLSPTRIPNQSITATQLASNSVTAAQIANRAVSPANLPTNLFRRVTIESTQQRTFAPNEAREIRWDFPSGWSLVGFQPRLSGRFAYSVSTTGIIVRNITETSRTINVGSLYCTLIFAQSTNVSGETVTRGTWAI
jgi:hypothetical protein